MNEKVVGSIIHLGLVRKSFLVVINPEEHERIIYFVGTQLRQAFPTINMSTTQIKLPDEIDPSTHKESAHYVLTEMPTMEQVAEMCETAARLIRYRKAMISNEQNTARHRAWEKYGKHRKR